MAVNGRQVVKKPERIISVLGKIRTKKSYIHAILRYWDNWLALYHFLKGQFGLRDIMADLKKQKKPGGARNLEEEWVPNVDKRSLADRGCQLIFSNRFSICRQKTNDEQEPGVFAVVHHR
jgi:hypothetical protein